MSGSENVGGIGGRKGEGVTGKGREGKGGEKEEVGEGRNWKS